MSENIKKTGLSHSVYQKANLLLLKKLAASEMKNLNSFAKFF